jgi:hypothetical protein
LPTTKLKGNQTGPDDKDRTAQARSNEGQSVRGKPLGRLRLAGRLRQRWLLARRLTSAEKARDFGRRDPFSVPAGSNE